MHVIAAKAIALKEAMDPEFKVYQHQVIANSREMVDTFITRGHSIVSGGTDNHLFLVDLSSKSITGKDAEAVLDRACITVNKNTVPNDKRSPFITSGLRIGTPAMTTRGMHNEEARHISSWICDILEDIKDESRVAEITQKVASLCQQFPVYEV